MPCRLLEVRSRLPISWDTMIAVNSFDQLGETFTYFVTNEQTEQQQLHAANLKDTDITREYHDGRGVVQARVQSIPFRKEPDHRRDKY
jgi:hypothetical protein